MKKDKYTLKARFYPVIVVIIPIFLVGVSYSIYLNHYIQALSGFVVFSALFFLLKQFGRDLGYRKQAKLWKDWGGVPTTQVLRYANDNFDKITKKKYHSLLFQKTEKGYDNMFDIENNDMSEADEIYKFWANFLRLKTRNRLEIFPLILQENIDYGFRRNLWGMKYIAISILIMLMIGVGIYEYVATNGNLYEISIIPVITEISLLFIFAIWQFHITEDWVKIPAFAYAKRLIESVEKIDDI